MSVFKEIYEYREMIFSMVRRDLRGRYKGSALGFLWTFLNPLFQLIVYTIVFSVIMKVGYEKYYLHLFTALVPWIFFSSSVAGGAGIIRAQSNLVNKIYFPREVIPISHVICQLINMLLTFLVVLAVVLVTGHGLNGIALLYLIPVTIVEFFLALGLTLITSVLTVFLRDIEYVSGIILLAWQFLSPVMYGIDYVPEKYRTLYMLNPMTPIIIAYRDIFYWKRPPELGTLGLAALMGILSIVIGFIIFEKLKKRFSENL